MSGVLKYGVYNALRCITHIHAITSNLCYLFRQSTKPSPSLFQPHNHHLQNIITHFPQLNHPYQPYHHCLFHGSPPSTTKLGQPNHQFHSNNFCGQPQVVNNPPRLSPFQTTNHQRLSKAITTMFPSPKIKVKLFFLFQFI